MPDMDQTIRDALPGQDRALFDETGGEQSFLEMAAGSFAGRNRWLTVLIMVAGVMFFGLTLYTSIRFFEAESTRAMIAWSVGCIICLFAVSFLKMWWWMELNKNTLMREIKRLELLVARLSQRLG